MILSFLGLACGAVVGLVGTAIYNHGGVIIAGAIVGSRLLGLFGIYSSGGIIPNILIAIVGAVILVALVRMLRRV